MVAFRVIAFNDNVGYACSIDCADAACIDINNDHSDSDAGYEPVNVFKGSVGVYCMGCGKEINT